MTENQEKPLFGTDAAQVTQVEPDEPEVIDVEAANGDNALAVAEARPDILTIKERADLALQEAQDIIQYFGGLRQLVIANARKGHWIRFGDRIRPDRSECLRLRTLLNIGMEITPPERYEYEDENGKYYEYRCTGQATLGPMKMPCFGAASSRTKFFNKSHGEYVDSREINPSFIAKMAWFDCLKKGVSGLLALDVDPNELEGITGEQVDDRARQFDHSKSDDQEQGGEREFIRTAILDLAGQNNGQASAYLEWLTTFKASDGKHVRGKKTINGLTQKQVANLHRRRNQDLTQAKFAEFVKAQQATNG